MKGSEYETAGDSNSGNNPTGKGKGKDDNGDEGLILKENPVVFLVLTLGMTGVWGGFMSSPDY
jgi:hypothetical protein